jgi:hypothetical protein
MATTACATWWHIHGCTANYSPDDTLVFDALHYLVGNHVTEWFRDNCFVWRQRVASLIPADQRSAPVPTQRGDRFARAQIQRTALSREEKNEQIKAESDRQLNGLPIGSLIAYTDGGADGNGANGNFSACGGL